MFGAGFLLFLLLCYMLQGQLSQGLLATFPHRNAGIPGAMTFFVEILEIELSHSRPKDVSYSHNTQW